MDQQETGQATLFLGNYEIYQVETITSSGAKSILLIGHNHINQAGIFASAHH